MGWTVQKWTRKVLTEKASFLGNFKGSTESISLEKKTRKIQFKNFY